MPFAASHYDEIRMAITRYAYDFCFHVTGFYPARCRRQAELDAKGGQTLSGPIQ
jgi:hypothetical protein